MTRITDVLDCWFDSGAMPFAQYHYPFENKELFNEQFPADFIAEGIDQTRGWFYTLLVISTFLTGKSPYKNVLVNDLLLDAEGKKMSKSRGNIVEPFTAIKDYGADTVRFYLPYVSPVWTPLKFDEDGLKDHWNQIPKKLDVLLTHMPPNINDCGTVLQKGTFNNGANYGSDSLKNALLERDIKYTFCGHVHSGNHSLYEYKPGCFISNVSVKDEDYVVRTNHLSVIEI